MQKGFTKKGLSKNTWNKGKLQNRNRARWSKSKTGIGLHIHEAIDGHRRRQSLVGLSAHCKFLHPARMYMLQDVGICTVCTQSN